MDKEIAHTIGAVTIAIINALNDEGYNAAVETLHRYASDETRSEKTTLPLWFACACTHHAPRAASARKRRVRPQA